MLKLEGPARHVEMLMRPVKEMLRYLAAFWSSSDTTKNIMQ